MAGLWGMILRTLRDLAPVVLVVVFFQAFLADQPLARLLPLLEGAALVAVGVMLLVYGLELALFPLGEALAYALAQKGKMLWLVGFAFLLGFGMTIAEPALTAVAAEAATTASAAGAIENTDAARVQYSLGLRLTVATAVGVALVLGVVRTILGWPLPVFVMSGWAVATALAFVAPPEVAGIAYDLGGVTSSVITVPLATALCIGLASSLSGRNPMSDGFGTVALVLLLPAVFVMAYALVSTWI
jgi:hypothetical protein